MRQLPTCERGISLRELLPAAEFIGADDIRVASCASDAQGVRSGDLFVLLHGESDPVQAILAAKARGATAVLAERPCPGHPLPTCVTPDSKQAFGQLCQALVGNPSRRLKLVGITGTGGNSSAAHLTASVLAMGGYATGACLAQGCHDGIDWSPAGAASPSPPVWADWLARVAANGRSHAVLEVPERALDESGLAGMVLDVACTTRSWSTERHGSMLQDGRHSGWQQIFDYLAPEGVALVNVDDAACAKLLEPWAGPAMTFGIRAPAEIGASIVEETLSEQTFLLSVGPETVPVRTHLVGRRNLQDCLAAAAVGVVYGIEPETIARGLEAVPRIPWRLERLECGQPFGVFIDASATPQDIAGSLAALRPLTHGRLICVLGDEATRDRPLFSSIAKAAEQGADLAVVNLNSQGRGKSAKHTDGPATFVRRADVHLIRGWPEAIRWALDEAQAGDCVLIAGKGQQDSIVEGAGRPGFDAREFACQCLYESAKEGLSRRISA